MIKRIVQKIKTKKIRINSKNYKGPSCRKKIWAQKIRPKKIWAENFGPKNFGRKILAENFGPKNLGGNIFIDKIY